MAKNWLTSHPILARFAPIRIIDLEAEVAEIRAVIDAGRRAVDRKRDARAPLSS